MKQRLTAMVLFCLGTGLLAGCSSEGAPHAVSRFDLVGRWHAGGSCGSSLELGEDGSAGWKRWATGYSVDKGHITGRQSGNGTWTLESYQGQQELDVKRGDTSESLTMLQDEGRLTLLQIPGEDPDNSIGCRFTRIDDHKAN
ncbi:hypothetical protein ACFYWS_20435 [Streptomyces sp. NPDC002795]|uniref:hypothetical protein n=1 Tax=Streptomyces sp. NPDC002795 TaxID=3364665 RepID=UPI0036A8D3D0